MNKLVYIFALLVAFAACSDDGNNDEPLFPIHDLVVPQAAQTSGQEVILVGNGFTKDSKIQLRPEGAEKSVDAEVVKVTSGSLIFKSPAKLAGKYMVILVQGGESYDLGMVNFIAEEAVGEGSSAGGVIIDDESMQLAIYRLDVVGKSIGDLLFSVDGENLESIVADNHGKIYCKVITFEETEWGGYVMRYEIHYYDTKTQEGGKIEWANADKCFSIGTDGEGLIAMTADKETDEIKLVSVSLSGEETVIRAYTDQIGVSYTRLFTTGGTFVYGKDYVFCGLMVDQGDNVSNYGYAFSLTEDNTVKKFSNGDAVYSYTKVGDTWYEFICGANGEPVTSVYTFTDENAWESAAGNPVAELGYDLTGVIYDPVSLLIYGFSDEGDSVISFNPKENTAFDKWVDTGCISLFILPE